MEHTAKAVRCGTATIRKSTSPYRGEVKRSAHGKHHRSRDAFTSEFCQACAKSPRARSSSDEIRQWIGRMHRDRMRQLLARMSQWVRPEVAGPMTGSAKSGNDGPGSRCSRVSLRSPRATKGRKKEKGSRTPVGADFQPPQLLLRQRACQSAHAFRRSTTALAQGSVSSRRLSVGPGFVGRKPPISGGVLPLASRPSSSDAPRVPVVVPAG
jgi:hypothetical protein